MRPSRSIAELLARLRDMRGCRGDVLYLPLAFLLGRLTLVGSVTPMALSLWATGTSVRWRPLMGALIAAGIYTRAGTEAAVLASLQLGIISLTLRMVPLRPAGRRASALLLAQTLGATWLWLSGGWTAYRGLVLVLELPMLVLLAVLLSSLERREDAGPDSVLPRLLVLSLAAAGMVGWSLGPVRLWLLACSLLVLAAVPSGYGGHAGITVGVITGLGSIPSAFLIGIHAVAGLVAGAFHRWGRLPAVAGYAAAALAMGLFATVDVGPLPGWHEVLIASLAFIALPAIPGWLAIMPGKHAGDAPLPQRLSSFASAFRELARAFDEVGATAAANGTADPSRLVARLVGEVCHGCSGYPRCWQASFYRTYTKVLDLIAGDARVPDWCLKRDRLSLYLERRQELARLQSTWARKADMGRQLLTSQLETMAAIVDEIALRPLVVSSRSPEPRLSFAVARESTARRGAAVSGDSTLIAREGPVFMAAISDGMGSGKRAAMESGTVLALMDKLLTCGMGHELAVKAVNAVMLFRSAEELFATLDLVVADRVSGECQFVKVGAAPTYISRAGQVFIISANSPPVGIMEDVDVQSSTHTLRPGDVIVLVSDGVLVPGSDGDELWLPRLLSRSLPGPRRLAGEIMAASLDRTGGVPRDDMTVMVVAVEERTP